MQKRDWVTIVDDVLCQVDHALDRVRKKPRRRLAEVPVPKVGPDPFVPQPQAAAPVEEVPLASPDQPLTIYGRRTCMHSGRARQIGMDLGLPTKFIDIDDPEHRADEARLIKATKRYETPWVFVRGEFLGSYDALAELLRSGALEQRALGESQSKSRIRIEAPGKPDTHGG